MFHRYRERERERGYKTAAIYNSRDTKNIIFIYFYIFISRQPRELRQPCFNTKRREIGTFIQSLFLVLDNLAFMTFLVLFGTLSLEFLRNGRGIISACVYLNIKMQLNLRKWQMFQSFRILFEISINVKVL